LDFFSGEFEEIWAKILRTHQNLPASTPMGCDVHCTCVGGIKWPYKNDVFIQSLQGTLKKKIHLVF